MNDNRKYLNDPEIKSPLLICTIRQKIVVGQKIPNEISFYSKGYGSGWINMGSVNMTHLFKKELSFLQKEDYIYSEICRNENEKIAFENAIKLNLSKIGYNVNFDKL